MVSEELREVGPIAQKQILLIPVFDVSGSMEGDRIGQVNAAMADVPEQLRKINANLIDTTLLIAPMIFSTDANWFGLINDKPVSVETFSWLDVSTSGLTSYSAVYEKLWGKLTASENGGWMNSRGGQAPIILLMSDGAPTDTAGVWERSLEKLQRRKWFRHAIKFAIAVGDGVDTTVLEKFTGNAEAIMHTRQLSDISVMIKETLVTASQVVSSTTGAMYDPNAVVGSDDSIDEDAALKGMQKSIVDQVNVDLTVQNSAEIFSD